MSTMISNSSIPEINLPQTMVLTLDSMPIPLIIRNLENRVVYINEAGAKEITVKSPQDAIGKLDSEMDSILFEDDDVRSEFSKQYIRTWTEKIKSSTLELHPNALDYPYIFHKMPFYGDDGDCKGMFGYNELISIYTLNDYIKGKLPGSLLLNKPDDFFTERQCEIMFYRLQGLKVKDVAARLNLSTNTVNNYMQTLYDKVGANNLEDFQAFCEKRSYHRYLPKRFLTNEAITFGGSII